jgi:hypothetical protein
MVKKDERAQDIISLILMVFVVIGMVSTIEWMVSVAPATSYTVGVALNGFSNPYSFEEAQKCDFVAANVYEGSEFFIINKEYYPKSLWEQSSKKRIKLNYIKSACITLGYYWEQVGWENYPDIGGCFNVYWSCMTKK